MYSTNYLKQNLLFLKQWCILSQKSMQDFFTHSTYSLNLCFWELKNIMQHNLNQTNSKVVFYSSGLEIP